MIPFEQLSEALSRWRAEQRTSEPGGNGAPGVGEPDELRDVEIEPEEVLEPEPEPESD